MHPMERLRYVARATGADQALIASETAASLGMFASDPAGLVTACRRMLAKQPTAGALWWLSSQVLASVDPMATAWECAEKLQADPTPIRLAEALPDGAIVTVLGWPDQIGRGLARRGDLEVRVVDIYGEGSGLVARLRSADTDAEDIAVEGLGAAVSGSDLVLAEAQAMGPTQWAGISGTIAASAVAQMSQVPVWVVAGVGRGLPQPLFDRVADAAVTAEPWLDEVELASLELAGQVLGPEGLRTIPEALAEIDCPIAAELLAPS